MVEKKWCENCKTMIEPIKIFDIVAFIILLCCGFGIVGIIYLIYYFVKEPNVCPRCRRKNLLWEQPINK